ncbi:uncharacterized protein LOC127573574 [Pristis pectinata]|uniref:uncharacterized protein LOC127573574 n=1 Tax=Pristis pectinata TaxID=685728 RepID=UPI00223D2022|nr:uncharacterized protein LOC127573574 [Pristis pectinata]
MGPKMIFEWICPLTLIVCITIGSFIIPVNTLECNVDIRDEQKICDGTNSTVLESELQSGSINDFCNYTVSQYACAQCDVLAQLTSENLTLIFKCFAVTRPVSISDLNVTTLFVQKISLSKLKNLLNRFNRKINDTLTIPLMAKETIFQALWERFKIDLKTNNTSFLDAFSQLFRPFIAGISQPILETLQYSDIVCENFKAIVQGLNAGLAEMTLTTKEVLERWIFGYINVTGVDCITNTSESRDWLLKNWGFISDLIQSVNLTNTSSSAVSTTVIQKETIRDTLLGSIFTNLKPLFPVFTPTNFSNWFQTQLPPLLPAITTPELEDIPVNITCESYQAIVKGFDTVFSNLTVLQLSEFFNFGKKILTFQLNSSGIACTGNVTGSREWIKKNFLKSLQGMKLRDLLALNKNFSGFEVLDLLTPQLLAELTVSSEAWFNVDRINQIIDTLVGRNFSDLIAYFTQFNYDTSMMNITTFQNTTVRDLMLSRIMQLLERKFSSFNTSDYVEWLQHRLFLLLPSITGKELATIPPNITCESYQAIIEVFNSLLMNWTMTQIPEINNFSKNILTSQLQSSGSADIACAANATASREWIQKNFLKYLQGLTYRDFKTLNKNFSGFEVLDLLTPQLLAELTVNSEAWFNTYRTNQIITTLTGRNFSDLVAYFTQFSYETRMMNITTFENTTVRDLMLSRIMKLLQPALLLFNVTDYAEWFQNRLLLLLPSITGNELAAIPTNITCESYQAIIQALDDLYLNLSKSQLSDVYNFSKTFLNLQSFSQGTGDVPCTANTTGVRDWLLKNFNKFMAQITFTDIPFLNKKSFLFEILDLLSIPQLSGLTVKSLNDPSGINRIIDILSNKSYIDLIGYVTQFVNETKVRNITDIQPLATRSSLLTGIMSLLRSYFTRFNDTDYAEWFQNRLQLLLPSINYRLLGLIPTNISCESYQAIVKGLDNLYLRFTLQQNREIYLFSKRILKFHQSLEGSLGIACAENSYGSHEWIIKNFFRFISQFDFSDFTDLNKNFSAFEVLDLLTAKQLSELTLESDVLNNMDKIIQILDVLTSRNFSDLVNYFNQFVHETQEMGITAIQNTMVRNVMLQRIFVLLRPHFVVFNASEYIDWFQNKLNLLLFGITQKELDTLPSNITCQSYQAIVKGLDNLYSNLSMTQQKDIYDFIIKYLTRQLNTTATACTDNTNGSVSWLLINFGRFRSFITFSDLLALNKNFIGLSARGLLTVTQLGQLAGNNGTLRNIYEVQKILSIITSDTVTEFIDAFSTAVNQNVVFAPGVGAALLEKVLNLSQSILSNASTTELQIWFGSRLQALLPSLTKNIVPLVFVSKSCKGFRTIVTILSSIKKKLSVSIQEAVYRNILAYNKVFPLLCYENTSFVSYLYNYYQNFSEFLTLRDTFLQIPSDRLDEVLKTIDPGEFTDLLSRPGFIDDNKFLITLLTRYLSRQNLDKFVDDFNLVSRDSQLTDDNRAALLKVFWTYFATLILPENNDTEVDKWLNVRLQPYLPFITTDLLISNITLGIQCLPYRKIVRTLNARYADLTTIKRKEIYNGIKVYLQEGPKPKCYDANDTALNSTAWFSNYLGLFMNQMSLTDLQSFFDNEAQIQEFVANPENQALLENLKLSTEVSKFFINLQMKNETVFNISSLPNSLVCFLHGTNILRSLNVQQILALIERVNDVCGLSSSSNRTDDATFLTDERRKLSILLVSKFDSFSVSVLNGLGQTAVGLSFSQIRSIDGNSLQGALPSLSKVKGWNLGQAKLIVAKLLKQNFQVNNAQNLLGLGSLVSGIPSSVFERIDPEVFKGLLSESTFVENIGAASQPLRMICVLQVLRNEKDPLTIVKNIPPVLAKEVPPVLLNSNLTIKDVNNKQWVPSQAAVFFESIIRSSNDYEKFSPSVLQGFSCGAVKTLNFTSFIELVQAMKEKRAILDESQLRCIYFRQNFQKRSADIDIFPVNVLLYFNSANFRKSQNCKAFFKAVGKANIDILPKGSARRQNLLDDALTCLGISGSNLSRDSVTVLGRLVCDLTGSVISESDISILDELKKCISFSESQRRAIEALLKSGKTRYSAPSSWSSSTIYELGNLPLTLTDTWREVKEAVINEALPRFIKKIKSLKPRGDVLAFIKQLDLQKESNNTTNCTMGQITAENIDDLTPAIYNVNQLDLCLSDRVLDDNVLQLGTLSFDPSQLEVLKNRLLQIYPNGLPEERIQILGNISTVFNATEVNSWNISEVDTLSELMKPQLENTMVISIITRYLLLGGTLNAVALKAIGGVNLCILNESQVIISNLTDAGALDLSTCTQSMKDFLYIQALSVLGFQRRNTIAYFYLMKPYLGGIPLGDLEALANNAVNMDFATFANLNPQVVKNLTAQNLIDLLGYNIQALQDAVNETVVVIWVNSHFESEVRRLGLPGGIPDPTRGIIFCAGKDSSALNNFLININPKQFCSFNITEYACAKTDLLKRSLNSDNLTDIFDCFIGKNALNTSDETALIVFLQKFEESTLNKALDKFSRKTLNAEEIPILTKVTFINSLWVIVKTNENLTSPLFLAKWFQERLRPFIAGISQSVVSPLLTRNLTCDGYQAVAKGLRKGFREMSPEVRRTVLKEWIINYLNTTAFVLNCYENGSFVLFLKSSFQNISRFLTVTDVYTLVPPDVFSEVLKTVEPSELVEVLSRPGFIDNYSILSAILIRIQPVQKLATLINKFFMENQNSNVSATIIEGIRLEFSRSLSGFGNPELAKWLNSTLIPSLPLISNILFTSRNIQKFPCYPFNKIIATLSFFKQRLNSSDQEVIYENILNYTKAFPLNCYENNSFTLYLKTYFQNYSDFLSLKDAFSVVPPELLAEVLQNTDPRELADLLRMPGFIDDYKVLTNLLINIRSMENLNLLVVEFITKTQNDNLLVAVIEGLRLEFQKSGFGVNGTDVEEWLHATLIPALPLISTTLFNSNNSQRLQCFSLEKLVAVLSLFKRKQNLYDQKTIYKNLLAYAKAFPFQCYENKSFVVYLKSYFQNYFNFLTLRDTVSLFPPDRQTELLNRIDLNELVNLLTTPGFVNDSYILTKLVLQIKPIQNLTVFLDAFANATQKPNLLGAVMEGVWIWFTESLSELTDAEVDVWLNVRLAPYLPFITTPILVSNSTLRVSCLNYRRIVKALNVQFPKLNSEKRIEIYNGIRAYLLQGPKPKCYNASDPVLNSTAWFSQYLGQYLSQASLSDLQSFSDNETLLQEFAANPENLKLLENVTLSNEVSTAYINLLVKNNPNFNASSLPNSLLCFITNTNLLQKLTAQQTLALIGRVNEVCGLNLTTNTSTDGTVPPEEPTDEQLKLAIVLVGKIDNFSVSTLNTLGQTAVGLSLSQVDSIDGNTLEQALPSLGNVRGWNIGQANSIVNRLLASGFQVNDTSRLLGLGSLVSGIPSGVFQRIDPVIFINVISNVRFVENIGRAPPSIRQICVLQVLRNVDNPVTTVRNIPSVLAAEVPPALLNSNLSLSDVNNKEWTPSQSAVFFQRVVRYTNSYEIFTPAVLRGFSCGATKNLAFATFLKLVRAMKVKEIVLDESQLECISGRITSERSEVPLDVLPGDVLLFNYQYFSTLYTCKDLFKLIGKSNVNLLRKVSAREPNILNDAKTCLRVTGRTLTKESLTILGGLVCDINGSMIMESDISVLDALKKCVSYRDDQKTAIEFLLRSGASKYGLPSSWSSTTIENLGNLPLALTETWRQINMPTLKEALPRFIKKIKRLRPPGDVLIFIGQLKLRGRSNNTATCAEGVIAPESINDLIPAIYDMAQLDLCLSDAVLKDGVLQLGSLAFDPSQLKVLKKRLLQIYPKGIPESHIQLLGNISTVFNATEVSGWNVTQVETLSALMTQQLENTTVISIITRFLQLGGNLNAVSLKGIGGPNLCTLNLEQLKTISNLTDAGALDLSACTQEKKRLLYDMAVTALKSQQTDPIPYFQLIKPYVGGARADELRFLANNRVNMDFATFKGLDPEEVKKLNADTLINLLGVYLQALRRGANETVVVVWVASNNESEVRKLGLTGGIPEPPTDNTTGNATVNETTLCTAIDSSALKTFLLNVNATQLCNFSITDYACVEADLLVSSLSSDDLADIVDCFIGPKALNRSAETALTIFIQKLNRTTLTEALGKFNSKILNTASIPLMTKITFMNALWETVKTFENLTSVTFLREWFQERFRPFIAGISQFVLNPLLTRNISCEGYQAVVKGLNNGFREMPRETRETVLNVWILNYLDTTGSGCISNTNGSRDWLLKNWGMFSGLVQIEILTRRNPSFKPLDAVELLTPSQLGAFAGKNGSLLNADDVRKIFNSITTDTVVQFIEEFRTAQSQNNVIFTPGVRTTLLQEILNRTQPIFSTANETELQVWFGTRLQALLPGLTENMLPLIFVTENCKGFQTIILELNPIKEQLNRSVQAAVYRAILAYTKAIPLRCYENNSFSLYLKSQFQNFSTFLTLSDALSLVPSSRITQVLRATGPSDLADLLSRPAIIDDNNLLTMLLRNYQPIQNLAQFVDLFNQKTLDDNLTDANLAAIIKGLWPQFIISLPGLNGTEQDEWLNSRLNPYLPFITNDLLVSNITLGVECLPYRKIVKALSRHYSDFASDKQVEIYQGIRTYLQQGPEPKCYDVTDPVLNSTAWFAEYLGLFMNRVSPTDLQSFANDLILQDFAADPENVALLNLLTLPVAVLKLYINLLVTNNPNINISGIPDSLICFTADTNLLQTVTGEQALIIIEKVNKICEDNVSSDAITDEQIKLSRSLVNKISNLSVSTLTSLQQSAVGLSVTQIENTDAVNVEKALPSLSTVKGWNIGQSKQIVSKLSSINFQFNNKDNLVRLGTLVAGISVNVLQRIESTVLVNVTSDITFIRNIQEAPQPAQQFITLKVLQTEDSRIRAVKKIPSALVKEIPPTFLTTDLNLQDVNDKQWVPSQAAVFFGNIVGKNRNFEIFSSSILQGFSCGAVVSLNDSTFLQLVQAVKQKRAVLDESQLSCMSYRLTSIQTPSIIDDYPEDVLLFFDSSDFRTSPNCKKFFKAIGKSNIDILQKNSRRRQRLLNNAFTCLGIGGRNLTREDVAVLGRLTCDLPGTVISNCDVTVLDPLRECTSYSDDQKTAIESLLVNKASRYGFPSSWSTSTVNNLGNLPLALSTAWSQVNLFVFNTALPRFIRKVKRFRRPNDIVKFMKRLGRRRRSRRAADCTVGQITVEGISELTPVDYDAVQLEACLSNDVLKDNVVTLGTLNFDTEQLTILKNKLSLIYPNGLPENQIQLLGNISTVFNVTEISSWNITEIETLSALMAQELENTTIKAIITKYLQSGGTLDAVSLKAIGGSNLCTLNESQLMTISELMNAGTLDISTCTQSKKNLLYTQAVKELASQPNSTIAYFNLIKPFLDGSNANDLSELAKNNISMDFATFTHLNPEEVAKLTANQLQSLLGINLPALQTGANETVVLAWVSSHFESEVRRIGLTGGIPDPSDPQLNFMCDNNTYNETAFCAAVNSSAVNEFLMSVNESQLCNFNITDYACAQNNQLLEILTRDRLTTLFDCYTSTKALQRQDETALGIFVQKLDKTILNEALDKFNNKTQNTASIPLMTKITFMNALWETVKTNENLTSSASLTKWFQERFRPFNAGISQAVLNCLLMQNTTCEGYQAVLKGLNNAFGEMLQATRETVLKVWILGYLNTTGAGCISNTNGSRDWLLTNWGMFRHLVNIEALTSLNSNFSGFDVLDLLNSRHLSELTVNSLNNINNINAILDAVASRNFTGLKEYMKYFVTNTQMMDIQVIQNTAVRDVMLNKIMQQLEAQFPAFNATDYAHWFQTKLHLLLPSIRSSNLGLIPSNITCESNQAIIKGLDNVYPSLSLSQIRNISTFASTYLSIQLKSTGTACTENAPNSRDWILKNFGEFRSQAQYSKLTSLNSNFMGIDVVDLLTVKQLAQLSASSGILNNSVNVQKIMDSISADNITQFMDVFSHDAKQNNISLAPEVATILLSEVLNRAQPIISTSNETELQVWLDTRLQLLIPNLNGNLTKILLANISCSGAQIIIRTLNAQISKFLENIQRQMYSSIRNYLSAGPKPRCYSASDPALNSTAWFANYFGKFLIYTSTDDLALLTATATLKLFTANQKNLDLLKSLNLPKEIQSFYAKALFTNENINFSSIPDSLVCFIVGTPSVQSLNAQQALSLLQKANVACQTPSTNGTAPTDNQMQLAVALVSKIDSFSFDTLSNLGQSAVGLTITQINAINSTDVHKALGSLGNVKGWTPGKSDALVKKLITANFQFNNVTNLLKMGTLVSGLTSERLENIDSNVIVSAINDNTFVENILLAQEPSQQLVVQKIIQSSNNPTIFIQRVPAMLASKIPLPQLISKDINLNLVNKKQWKPFQAAVFFGILIGNRNLNFNVASASVLQGFSCAAGNNLDDERFKKFVTGTKDNVSLNADQLICMFRRLNATETPGNISDLPADVLIYYTPEAFPSENCTSFFRAVGHANINVVSRESQERKNLLKNAKICLNISAEGLSRDDVTILNNLVCDYDGDITKSDISILEALKSCTEYTPIQQNAINTLLNNHTQVYGDPSTWNTSTLENLGTLVFAVNGNTWKDVKRAVILDGLKTYVGRRSKFQIQRQRDLLLRLSLFTRAKRATGCGVGEITASMTFDVLLPAQYGASDLDECLNNTILKDYLFQLGSLAFSEAQLEVLKEKLNQIYPNGIPEEKIQLLGYITSVYNSTDINTWNVTKLETLSATLSNSLSDDVSKAIMSRYLSASRIIDTAVLNIIGGRVLCLLDESQLEKISRTNISNANPLNISSCSQSKKNLIYNKAKSVIELQNNDSVIYYNQMKTYFGGASSAHLQTLASQKITMDPSVFLALNPEELKELSANELKNLLGINLQTVKTHENSTLVQAWISQHTKSEVRSLGIGLTGGKPDSESSGLFNILVIGSSSSSSINKNYLQCLIQSFSISAIIIVLQVWL